MTRIPVLVAIALLLSACDSDSAQEPRELPGAAARQAAERAGAAVAEREREVDSILRTDTVRSPR
jgi:hypothetical protein